MDYNLISSAYSTGMGAIYQGGSVDDQIKEIEQPLIIFCMDKGEQNEHYIAHPGIDGVVSIWIDDSPTAVLPDTCLIAHVAAAISYLRSGYNLYIHCGAGVSRSSYLDIAVHMALMGFTYDQAASYVKSKRPVAQPNPGFEAHLRRLEPQLKGMFH